MKPKQELLPPAETDLDGKASIDAANKMIPAAEEIIKELVIDSPQMYALAIEEIRAIELREKALVERRMSITRKIDAAKKDVMDLFRAPVDRLHSLAESGRKLVSAYLIAERDKADALRREQEAADRAEKDKLEAEERRLREEAEKAAAKGHAKKAAELLNKAGDVVDKIDDVDSRPLTTFRAPVAAGTSTRENWKFEVRSLRELVLAAAEEITTKDDDRLLAYLTTLDTAIGSTVRNLREKHRIPGVRAWREDTLAIKK